jgi:hypothetical protein
MTVTPAVEPKLEQRGFDCDYPKCDCHDAEITITFEKQTPKHYCCSIHAAQALLVGSELTEAWIMDDVRARVKKAKNARYKRLDARAAAIVKTYAV